MKCALARDQVAATKSRRCKYAPGFYYVVVHNSYHIIRLIRDSCLPRGKNYDKCFTEFFQKFIAPNYRHKYAVNPCDRLHQAYRECVEQRLATDRPFEIDLSEVQKEFLNTEGDKLRDTQQEK
ncbi:hypothetical protein Y032_0639g984 [Ancylostoma ceylanicum]|uniref:Uncharacterized protein n=1 Tax=Ancylostoma ceylanicum TaxID=53326 RepID=A0A016WJ05_9BILA|nr:hypothetical protein Y032_0639g984 [Ancylostoma ceylanicum]